MQMSGFSKVDMSAFRPQWRDGGDGGVDEAEKVSAGRGIRTHTGLAPQGILRGARPSTSQAEEALQAEIPGLRERLSAS